ncbi:hypothetical protein LSH36_262g02033 [Paralvinella palmiformis]|uniref:Uncharacterized protein n=1 Tax=Paralvinella palmiformis TaxID=53620 RepID=A0AAD9JK13_9ANNE|nr:hypothetical protein LSH36_262g02033 [Paralvinella palmiformis]
MSSSFWRKEAETTTTHQNTKVSDASFEECNTVPIPLHRLSLVIIRDDVYSKYLYRLREIKTDIVDDKVMIFNRWAGSEHIAHEMNRYVRAGDGLIL